MKMLNRLLALVMALLLCCGAAMAEAAKSPDDVMVTVNGTPVTRAEYEVYLSTVSSYYANQGYDVTAEGFAEALQEIALMTLVQYAVMDQKMVEMGVTLTEEEKADAEQEARETWNATIDEGLAYYGATDTTPEDELAALLVMVLAELESMGYTEQGFIDEAVVNAGYIKLENEMIKDVVVTDEEVMAYYNELVAADEVAYRYNAAAYEQTQQMNQMWLMLGYTDMYTDLYYFPEGYRSVSHILLEVDEALLTAYADLQAAYEEQQSTLEEGGEVTDELVTAEEVENARLAIIASVQPTIDEINQKLAEGVAFAELIPQYTTDPGMNTPEAIAEGYPVHMDSTQYVTGFAEGAFSVDNIGDVTGPVLTEFGVHILQYIADIPGGPVEMDQNMMETLRMTLLEPAQSEKLNETMSQWLAEADIVFSDEAKTFVTWTNGEAAE